MIEKKDIIEKMDLLMNGVDPFTGELFDKEHILNSPEYVRLFAGVIICLQNTSKQSSSIKEFYLLEGEIDSIEYPKERLTISVMCKLINNLTDDSRKKLNAATLNKDLEKVGILKTVERNDGKKNKVLEDKYLHLGENKSGTNYQGIHYTTVLYNEAGFHMLKKFVTDTYTR